GRPSADPARGSRGRANICVSLIESTRDTRGYLINLVLVHRCERASRASHATGASRRSGERGRVSGSPRGEAPRLRLDRGPLDQKDRQVVDEPRRFCMSLNGPEYVQTDFGWALSRMALDDRFEPGFFERSPGRIFGFGDAVAIHDEHFSWREHRIDRRELRMFEHAERDTGAAEAFIASVLTADHRRILAGIDVRQPAGCRGVDGVEQCDEA